MAFSVRPAASTDVAAMALAHQHALDHLNDLYAAFFKLPIGEAFQRAAEAAHKNAANTNLVAEQVGTGTIGGFVRYEVMPATTAEPESASAQSAEQKDEATPAEPAPPAPFARKEHMEDLWQKINERWDEIDACEKAALQGQRYIYIKHLMVEPAWQRKGLGTMLMSEVLSRADAEGIPCYIVSSAESQGLYAKLGFQELGTWVIDDEYWAQQVVQHERSLGMTGNEKLVEQFAGVREVEKCMLRMPRK